MTAQQQDDRTPVTQRALLQRFKRKDIVIKVARTPRARKQVGRYFEVSLDDSHIVRTHINLEAHARRLRLLEKWERLA